MNYALEQRMRLIDFLLFHYGSISRTELMDYFGIEAATATRDFAEYKRLGPNNMLLSPSKRYIRSDTFVRLFE